MTWDALTGEVGDILSGAFDEEIQVTAIPTEGDGANASRGTHRVAETAQGPSYSLKICSRRGESEDDTRRSAAVYRAMEAVKPPNHSLARSVCLMSEFPDPFGEAAVLLIKRASGDVVKLKDTDATLDLPVDFLEQYGEWSVFIALVGTGDRKQNVLWDKEDDRILHIDFEDSFGQSGEIREALMHARSSADFDFNRWRQDDDYYLGEALERGMLAMHEKLQEKRAELIEVFKRYELSQDFIDAAGDWIDLPFNEKVARAQAAY